MNIAYLSNSIIPSRSANSVHVMKMCQALSISNNVVTLFAIKSNFSNENYFHYYGVKETFKVINLQAKNIRVLGPIIYSFNVKKYINNHGQAYDLYYGRDIYSFFILPDKCTPMIFEVHSTPASIMHKYMMKKIFMKSNFHKLIVISDALKKEYLKIFSSIINESDIIVAHDGADIPKLSIANSTKHDLLPGKSKFPKVGYIGHLYEGRGIEVIVELAERIKHLDFHVIGGTDEDLFYWKSKTKNISNLFFLGYIPNGLLQEYYKELDIMLSPYQKKVMVMGNKDDTSRWMSPMKLFEYMSFSKAIISSDLPVLREVLIDTENSLLCQPNDIDEWEKKLLSLVRNKDLREHISNNGQRCLKEKYTWLMRSKKVLEGLYI